MRTTTKDGGSTELRRAVGWREWIELPELGSARVKAKVDTGARTSALHAWNIEAHEREGHEYVSFDLHPIQDDDETVLSCSARVLDKRSIRNSGGQATERYVIATPVHLGTETFDIELTLTQRDEMGFRMLLGRTAIRQRFLVDVGRSFLGGQPI